MKCRCNTEMVTHGGYWKSDDGAYAFCTRLCPACGTLAKEDLWENKGVLWIFTNGTTLEERP